MEPPRGSPGQGMLGPPQRAWPPGWFGAARRWAWEEWGRPKRGPMRRSQNYIHINKIYTDSRSTAIQRPANIYIYIYIYIYIFIQRERERYIYIYIYI